MFVGFCLLFVVCVCWLLCVACCLLCVRLLCGVMCALLCLCVLFVVVFFVSCRLFGECLLFVLSLRDC